MHGACEITNARNANETVRLTPQWPLFLKQNSYAVHYRDCKEKYFSSSKALSGSVWGFAQFYS